MKSVNPLYIPRNHEVERALAAANEGDLEPFRRLNTALAFPFEVQSGFETLEQLAPEGTAPHVTYCGT